MAFSDVVRREFRASDEARDKGLTTSDGVVRYDDISYLEEGNRSDFWHLLDVYRPKSAGDAKLPVIVSVHGGGWVYGDKDVYQYYCMDLCRRGFAVVNFSYRLAPEHKHPAQVEDTVLAFKWVKENAFKYGFDLEHLYAVGDSAGANILSLYCIMCNKENNLPLPKAVALNCGVYNVNEVKREMRGFMSELMPNMGTTEELAMLDIISQINEQFPPVFLMTCYGDFLKSQAPLLEERLKQLGIPYVSRVYGSEEHPLKHVFHCDIQMAEATLCNDETCEFFNRSC
ncbi:MAG: alpha/beta hydrolase [Lachnospiraceae bacterium]|nr:alpha/beta hydrolase [Lachnospiraceae bacterium]